MSRNNKPQVPWGVYTGEEDRSFFNFLWIDHDDDDEPYREPLWFWEL